MNDTYTIGELSRKTGVPVKTIRYYHEEGILQPHGTTEAGYRLYTTADEERLNSIRSFRALGFSLDAIRTMLDNPQDARMLAQLQLHVLQTQLRALRRQMTIVESALELDSDDDIRARLQLANAAASLAAQERQAHVDAFIERASRGHADNAAKIRQMALLDLPDELDAKQLEAWIELSTLLRDDGFLATIHKQHQPFDGQAQASGAEFGREIGAITGEAQTLYTRGAKPGDPQVQELVDRWTRLFAGALGRERDAAFLRWFLTYSSETNDPRIERFWQLVGTLRGCAIPSFTGAYGLLIEGLRTRIG
jgi:DNA-binding transcriptional MerR regulator